MTTVRTRLPVCCLAVLLALPVLAVAQENGGQGRKVALLVGINAYQKPFFPNLGFAERDVEETAKELKKLGFEVTLLQGKEATREKIDQTVNRLVKPLAKEDVMLVMLCGHGLQRVVRLSDGQSKDDAFFCPYDAVENDHTTLFSLSYLIDEVLAPNVGRKLLLVDACRDDPDAGRGVSRGIEGKVIALPEGTAVMFSCLKGQRSWENGELRHGLFTYTVLEGLRGAAVRDGEVAWGDLTAYVNRRMASREFARYIPEQRRQDPIPAGGVPHTVLGRLDSQTPETLTNSLGMRLKLIPAGEFLMGSTPEQIEEVIKFDASFKKEWGDGEQPRHRVRISKPFYMGVHEVTKGQFAQFVREADYRTEPERDGEGGYGWNESEGTFEGRKPQYTWRSTGFAYEDDHPVVNVTWNDAVAFCDWLSRKEGRTYRLPTEAEWEYACRAGTSTLYQHGDDPEGLARVGNVADGTAKEKFGNWNAITARDGYVFTAPVGRFRPNAFGLYDMHGNVWEWCADRYGSDYYGKSPVDDPQGPDTGSGRVCRGGGWNYAAGGARSAFRDGFVPSARSSVLGFRVAMSPSGE